MPTRTIEFPLTLPEDGQTRSQCATCLEQEVGRYHGVHQVRVIRPNGEESFPRSPTLELTYDPATISLEQLRGYIGQTGCGELDPSMAQVLLPIEGLISPRKESTVQAVLNRLPGVTAVVSFASQTIRLEFDRNHCALPEVVRQLERLGIRVRSPKEVRKTGQKGFARLRAAWADAMEYPQLSTAILGGLFLVIATATHLMDGPHWLRLSAIALAYLLCGWHTARETLRTLLRHGVDIDVLMFAAAFGAALLGAFEEGALLLLLFALGGAGEQLAMGKARKAIEALTKLTPQTATRIEDGQDHLVAVEELAVGDRIRIGSDEQVPADAQILEGRSAIDQSAITGESVPVEKQPGDNVFAGTMNSQGVLIASVTRTAKDNTLAKVIQLVEQAQTTKSPTQQLAERFERRYVPVVLLTTAALMLVPPLVGWIPNQQDGALWSGWFYQALAFLTAASPCALAIGTPAAVLSGVGKAARIGVLVKGGVHLENLARVGVFAFDKTGTLTQGRPRVVSVTTITNDLDENALLALTAAIERGNRHPLAVAIFDEATSRQLTVAEADDIQRVAGQGIVGKVDGRRIRVGSSTMFRAELDATAELHQQASELQSRGQTLVCVGTDDQVLGMIGLADQPRESAREALADLKAIGIHHSIMLTGDHEAAARFVASSVGIDEVEASLLPEQKLQRIGELAHQRQNVAMVGDGVNDAPALAAATVGIAIGGASGGASDVALETADIALLSDDLRKLPQAVKLARFSQRIIRQNLVIALGVIALLAPAAAMGLAPISIAVLFHEGSTVLVVVNALRILRFNASAR